MTRLKSIAATFLLIYLNTAVFSARPFEDRSNWESVSKRQRLELIEKMLTGERWWYASWTGPIRALKSPTGEATDSLQETFHYSLYLLLSASNWHLQFVVVKTNSGVLGAIDILTAFISYRSIISQVAAAINTSLVSAWRVWMTNRLFEILVYFYFSTYSSIVHSPPRVCVCLCVSSVCCVWTEVTWRDEAKSTHGQFVNFSGRLFLVQPDEIHGTR